MLIKDRHKLIDSKLVAAAFLLCFLVYFKFALVDKLDGLKGSQDNAKFIRRYVGIVLKKLFASRTTALIVNSCLGFCFFDTQGRKDSKGKSDSFYIRIAKRI